jgi:hypothetical protein
MKQTRLLDKMLRQKDAERKLAFENAKRALDAATARQNTADSELRESMALRSDAVTAYWKALRDYAEITCGLPAEALSKYFLEC